MKRVRLIVVFLGSILFSNINAFACGPDFDDAYFVRMSPDKFFAIPEGHFLFELRRISGVKDVYQLATEPVKHVTDADIDDLKKALVANHASEIDINEAVNSYQRARTVIADFLDVNSVGDTSIWYGGRFRNLEGGNNKIEDLKIEISSTVPEEFSLYLKGAAKYHGNDLNGAISEWQKILKLPEGQRHYKGTWAAFMIGKSYLSIHHQTKAIPYFELTRKMVEQGDLDSLNLNLESLGWQALAEFEVNDYVASIKHYLKQMDVNSLNWVCTKIIGWNDSTATTTVKEVTLSDIVKDETARNVLLGWAVSQYSWNSEEMNHDVPYKDFYGKLLKAIERIKDPKAIDNADRIAWLYYNQGDMAKTKSWLALTKLQSLLAKYVEFKVTLREGKVDDAISKLSALIPAFEESQDKDIFYREDVVRKLNSEMALLKLSRKEYIKAFEISLNGKYWEDIAYLAEKVLTSQELENYLKTSADNPILKRRKQEYDGEYIALKAGLPEHPADNEWYMDSLKEPGPTLMDSLRYLLARRYAREGNWDKADEYMPVHQNISRTVTKLSDKGVYLEYNEVNEDINPKLKLQELRNLLGKAQNENLSKNDRAQAYFDAGIIVRRYGMELIGTELDPDGFVFGGGYSYTDSLEERFGILTDESREGYKSWYQEHLIKIDKLREEIKKNRGFLYGSADEEKRAVSSLPTPNKRFHYRYKAADLMWKSAELLPDNVELKAKALCYGGRILKDHYPKEADKFYKELVRTCPKTKLGQEANKIRWFPKME